MSTDRKHILLVASTLHLGGAEMVIANMARHIDRAKFEVTVCCLKQIGTIGDQLAREGIGLTALARKSDGRPDYFTSLRLIRLIRDTGVHIVHSHDTHGLADCSLARQFMPRLRHVHTFHFGNYPELAPNHARIERLAWRRPDTLIAVGESQARSIQAYYGMKNSRLRVVRNGVAGPHPIVDAAITALAERHRDWPIVTSISTLTEQKGLTYLLQAVRELKDRGTDVLLLLAGDGPLRRSLQHQANQLGLMENVEFLGWIPEAARRLLPLSDIFVQSSLWEAMSVVVLEAMAAGMPMVVTAVGENPYILRDGVSALLVPPREPGLLAIAVDQLVRDRQLAARLGVAAKVCYQNEHRTERMVRNYESIYAELLVAPSRRHRD